VYVVLINVMAPWGLLRPGAIVIKLILSVIYGFCNKLECLSFGKPFQPSLMFVGETRSLPWSGSPERCFTRVSSGLRRRKLWKNASHISYSIRKLEVYGAVILSACWRFSRGTKVSKFEELFGEIVFQNFQSRKTLSHRLHSLKGTT